MQNLTIEERLSQLEADVQELNGQISYLYVVQRVQDQHLENVKEQTEELDTTALGWIIFSCYMKCATV